MTAATLVLLLAGCREHDAPDTVDDGVTPGNVVLHRLNRTEYDLTVRDLLGTSLTPARDFPADDTSHGFDNIADTLSVSPLHVELYELAAQQLADEIVRPGFDAGLNLTIEPETDGTIDVTGGEANGQAWEFSAPGLISAPFVAPAPGRYTLSVRGWASGRADVVLGYDGQDALQATLGDPQGGDRLEVEVTLSGGPHQVELEFVGGEASGDTLVLAVDVLQVVGPRDVLPGPNPMRDRWVTCDPDDIGPSACAEVALRALAPKAWRRPVEDSDVAEIMAVVDEVLDGGGSFEEALGVGITAVLVSPRFVYRIEQDRAWPGEVHRVDPYELASRLSYFLWSSMPDDALFEAAARDELRTEAQIAAQVERMLLDPKAEALVDNFAGQWLFIRGVQDAFKDPLTFPEFDNALKASMANEMSRFFDTFVRTDRDMHELLTATAWEIDENLAEHYGITDFEPGWHETDLTELSRRGVLGQAGWLSVNAYPTRTSPVIRGKFVLGQFLCAEPPQPPPNVAPLSEEASAGSVRERLEQHRADPNCAVCHLTMDDIGFGLENFDGVGKWRDEDAGVAIDATGTLLDQPFDGSVELAALLASDPEFEKCMAEQAFTYALGRLPTLDDGVHLSGIDERFAEGGFTFRSLATAIATSAPFTHREVQP